MESRIVKNVPLSQQIYSILKNEILHHRFAPGERLVDTQIADRFGVSRTPVRDAMLQLVHVGLVENDSRGGCHVREICEQDIYEIYEIRSIIEKNAIKKIISAIQSGDEEIRNKMNHIRQIYVSGTKSDMLFSDIDRQMHDDIIYLNGNNRLFDIYKTCCNLMMLFRQDTDEYQNRIVLAHGYHMKLLNAICECRLQDALEAEDTHIKMAISDALKLLK
ncbi:MAG: hypothetical protein ACFWUC_10640 [Oscillospiraceae bacterium]|jgi:DNA-binding GntR family transcriptional regulator